MSVLDGTTNGSDPSTDVNKLNLSENDWQNVLKNLSSSSMSSLQVTLKKVLGDSFKEENIKQLSTPIQSPMLHLPILSTNPAPPTPQTSQAAQTILVAFTANNNNNNNSQNSLTKLKPIGQARGITTLGQLTTPAISSPISTVNTNGISPGTINQNCLTLNQVIAANQIANFLQQAQQNQLTKVLTNNCPDQSLQHSLLAPAQQQQQQLHPQQASVIGLGPGIQNVVIPSPASSVTATTPIQSISQKDSTNSLYALATAAVEVAGLDKVEKQEDDGTSSVNLIVDTNLDSQKRKCLVETRGENNPNIPLATSTVSPTSTYKRKLNPENLAPRLKLEQPENTENMEPLPIKNYDQKDSVKDSASGCAADNMSQSDLDEDDESEVSFSKDDDIKDSMQGNDKRRKLFRSSSQANNSNNTSTEDNNFDNEAIRKAKRRERNRVAAARCRQRRQDQIGELQNQVTQLYQTGESLRTQIKMMEFERNRLEKQIKLHNMTECQKSLTLNPHSPYKDTELPPLSKILRLDSAPTITMAPSKITTPDSMSKSQNNLSNGLGQQIRPKVTGDEIQSADSDQNVPENLKLEVKISEPPVINKAMSRPNSLQISPEVCTKLENLTNPILNSTTTLQQSQSNFANTTPSLTPSTLRLLGQLAGTPTINQTNSPFITSTAASTASPLACLRLNSALNLLSPGIDLNSLAGLTGSITSPQISSNLTALNASALQAQSAIPKVPQNGQPSLLAISSSIENGLQIFRMISNPASTSAKPPTISLPASNTPNAN